MILRKTGLLMAGGFVSSILSAVCYAQSWSAALERYSHSNQVAAWMWSAVLLGLVAVVCTALALMNIGETIDLRHEALCEESERRDRASRLRKE